MKSQANARAPGFDGPPYRRLLQRLAAIDDGAILRVAFLALLAGTAAVLFVDFREMTDNQATSLPMPLQPILPRRLTGPIPGPCPPSPPIRNCCSNPCRLPWAQAGN